MAKPLDPPVAPRKAHTWHRPNGDVDDPWAWLLDRDDPDTVAYLTAENDYTDEWFAPQAALRETLFGEIRSRIQETDLSVPTRKGPWWYVTRTEEGRNYAIHCRGTTSGQASETVILDENTEAEGHDYFAVGAFDVSASHDLLAWSSDTAGNEEYVLRVRDLDTGTELADRLEHTYYGTAWSADDEWLFYTVPDEAMRPHQVWRHRLGTAQSDDVLVLQEDDERFYLGVDVSRDERWIILTSESKQSGEVWVLASDEPTATPRSVLGRLDEHEYSVEPWGDRFVIVTNDEAEDFRVVTIPSAAPAEGGPVERDQWTELIAHLPGRRITGVEAFDGHLVVHEWAAAQPQLRILFASGDERLVDDRRGAERRRARRQPGVQRDHRAVPLPVAHHTVVGVRGGRDDRRAHAPQADAGARRRPLPLPLDPHLGHLRRRHRRARRRRLARRHGARRHGAAHGLRLRLVRGVDAAVVLAGAHLDARPRVGLGARPSPRRR